MTPLQILLGLTLSFAGGTWYGMGLGEDREFAKRAREDAIVSKVGEAAQLAAAGEIAKIKPRNITIRQELDREIQTRVEYRDCRHGPDGLRLINEALTGRAESAGDRQLPGTDSAGR